MDEDLDRMSREQLIDEIKRLRQGVRAHRDSTRHELCWHHPALWGLLPEKTDPIPVVPDWPQFLQGCLRYRQSLDEQAPDAPRTTELYQRQATPTSTQADQFSLRLDVAPPKSRTEGVDMATTNASGVRLFYELGGRGDVPLVLVHGSWGSHHGWDAVAPALRESFRVLTYDRRGHSTSERPSAQGSVRDDVADLATLIEQLGLAPAWVAGNSFGASIALRLAGARPDLLRGIIAHEPPLLALLASDPDMAPMLDEIGRRIEAVVKRIDSGDHAGAAEQFVETVALGPGAWAQIPPPIQQTFVENAPTFLDEVADPEQLTVDLGALKAFPRPMLLTTGDASPPIFAPVMAKLRAAVPGADVVTFAGAGHIPHVTHADVYIEVLTAFIRRGMA